MLLPCFKPHSQQMITGTQAQHSHDTRRKLLEAADIQTIKPKVKKSRANTAVQLQLDLNSAVLF